MLGRVCRVWIEEKHQCRIGRKMQKTPFSSYFLARRGRKMQKTPYSSYFLARWESGVVEETDTEITLSYVFRHFLRLRQIRGRLRKIGGRERKIGGRQIKI